MAPCGRSDGAGFSATKHRIGRRRRGLMRCYIVTPSLILCKDYITAHTAVWKRVLLCCAAFEATTTYVRRKRARWGLRWSSKAVKAQSKFAFNVKLVNILTRSLGEGGGGGRQWCVFARTHARTHSIPASPNTPWLTARASAKAPCRICILPTGIIQRVESWTRSRSRRAYFVTKQTTLCAISCCQSSFCSSTLASYHPSLPKAPGR